MFFCHLGHCLLSGEGTSYNGLSLGLRPEGVTFFRLQVYERGGDSRVEVYERIAYV